MDQAGYRKLISGESRGAWAKLLRFLLLAASQVYTVVVRVRNFLYTEGWLKTAHVGVKVISVGNITTGGTGKTPLVVWLCKTIAQKYKCAILTRGYKAIENTKFETHNYNDEPAILAESCPKAKVIINPNRIAGAAEAITKYGAKVLIMDDGFQHRKLGRDIDIVTIDATEPFGYGKMLPAGLLREPIAELKRADVGVITRCDLVAETELRQLGERLKEVNSEMIIARSVHRVVCAKTMDGGKISVEEFGNKKIFAFCGIGNPGAFFATITGLGAKLVGSKVYDDHHYYTENDVDDIYEQARKLEADLILSTQKDWCDTVLPACCEKDIGFAYLAVEIGFIKGEEEISVLIERALAGTIPRK